MIENRQLRLPRHEILSAPSIPAAIEERLGPHALRWYVAAVDGDEVVIEATFDPGARPVDDDPDAGRLYPGKTAVVSIVPTGVGCEVGGYAGDAAPATRLLAAAADYVITNPNAVNASDFISLAENVLYVEGSAIDLLCQGKTALYLPHQNRVGLIVERTSDERLELVYNVVNAVRAVHGVEIVDVVVTERPIGSRCLENASGAYAGTVDRPQEIADAAEQLVARGADAIAITTDIQDLPHDAYVAHFEGRYPNPMGGVEAIISHLIVNRFRLPAAHAPMINKKDLALADPVVDARGAGEMASASGLACVLIGLARAPQLRRRRGPRIAGALSLDNVLAVVAPAGCLGGIPTLYAQRRGIPVIAVEANRTVLSVTAAALGLEGVLSVSSYAEAAGVVLALARGIAPASVLRPLATLRPAGRATRGEREEHAEDADRLVAEIA
ncbi:MAG: DUF3326 domain-containing protein [Acidobacteria bacterium]|nr:MAG: DUF3326 domain-containing protein [Acidobacteriota bacterium]